MAVRAALLLLALVAGADAFTTPCLSSLPATTPRSRQTCVTVRASGGGKEPHSRHLGRRALLKLAVGGAGLAAASPEAARAIFEGPATEWYRPDGEAGVVPKYSGEEWKGPTWPKPEGEESISWKDFLQAMKDQDVVVVDFVGKNGEKVYAWKKSTQARIRVGEGLPDETTPPPPSAVCAECLEYCKPEDKTCSCLSACGGRNDWNSPLYTAKTIKRAGVPFRYSREDDKAFVNPLNLWRKWVMFDGPISAGLI